MKMSKQIGAVALLVSMLAAGTAFGQVPGIIVNTGGNEFKGTLRWKAREKAYAVTADNRELEVPLASVQEIKVAKPKALDDAEKMLREGNAAGAIPPLKKITADYLMLTWDKPATRLLAEALLRTDKHDEVISVCETVIRSDPDAAFLGEFAPLYWQALLKSGGRNVNKVEDLVTKAIKSGDRTASAFALNMRADLILATGDTVENAKKALKDGYLRVLTLYTGERGARPEALYKAAKCFEKLGQPPRADSLRSELKKDFATTEWARKP